MERRFPLTCGFSLTARLGMLTAFVLACGTAHAATLTFRDIVNTADPTFKSGIGYQQRKFDCGILWQRCGGTS